jgi:glucose-1-phosphatase
MIAAITFDLDGVYFPSGKAAFIKALGEQHGIAESEAKRVFLQSDEMNKHYKMGTMSDIEFWSWATKEWKLGVQPKQLIDLLISSYTVDPQVEAVVLAVRQHGMKTLVCSNNFPARVRGLQERFGFLDNFDAAVFSYEVGATKPSEAIFKELVWRSGIPAAQVAFADDEADNLTGAESVGITTFIYEGFDKFIEHLRKLGVELS